MSSSLAKSNRNSSVELLKIIAIIFIVLSHVIQTLCSPNSNMVTTNYIVNLNQATTNFQNLILAIFRSSGAFGNAVFFSCSAWFLIDSKKFSKQKWLDLFLNVWFISVISFVIVFALRSGNIEIKQIIKSFMPTWFNNNWYLTAYLLFYPVHPILNLTIEKMNKTQHLRLVIVLVFLYSILNVIRGSFFSSDIIIWIMIYYTVAYVKKHLTEISNNKLINYLFVFFGAFGQIALVCGTDLLGLRFERFSESLLRWNNNCNPFLIITAIALLNVFRNMEFKNSVINYISSLTLFIYLIHENILFRKYHRPLLWIYVYEHYGYDKILFWALLITVIVFAFGLICSIIYQQTVKRIVDITSKKAYIIIVRIWNKIEKHLLKIK